MKTFLDSQPRLRSFTLVEMLVAISILSLMILAMAQMTQMVSSALRQGLSSVDNFTKSRSTLDLITGDLQRGVFRSDIPSFLTGAKTVVTNGETYFSQGQFTNAFYTRSPGINVSEDVSVRDLSLVSYGLTASGNFQRGDLAVTWAPGSGSITFGNDSATNGGFASLLGGVTVRPEAPGIVGFVILFRRLDGSIVPSDQYTGEDFSHGPVISIGVALAVVGEQALKEMTPSQLAQLASGLAKVTVTNSAKEAWDQAVISQNILAPYPKDLGTSFQTFERWVPCERF